MRPARGARGCLQTPWATGPPGHRHRARITRRRAGHVDRRRAVRRTNQVFEEVLAQSRLLGQRDRVVAVKKHAVHSRERAARWPRSAVEGDVAEGVGTDRAAHPLDVQLATSSARVAKSIP